MPNPMPQGAVPSGMPQEARGAAPQAQAQAQGSANVSPEDLEFFRNGDKELQQAISQFLGRPVTPEIMKSIPDNVLVQVAGMVHKLGVAGAVAMAQKMIPPQVQAQLKAAQ